MDPYSYQLLMASRKRQHQIPRGGRWSEDHRRVAKHRHVFYTDTEEVKDQPLLPSSLLSGYDSLEYFPPSPAPSERRHFLLPSSGANPGRISSYDVDDVDNHSPLALLSGYNTLKFSPPRCSQPKRHRLLHRSIDLTMD